MREYVRFAVISLSVLIASSALAADLRPTKVPKDIPKAFSPKAKVRVLNVWATWCVPCVQEMPDLRAIDAPVAKGNCHSIGLHEPRRMASSAKQLDGLV